MRGLVLLLLSLAGVCAACAHPHLVIPPGQEPLVTAMFATDRCAWRGASIEPHRVVSRLSCPPPTGEVVVVLGSRGADAHPTFTTGVFDVEIVSTGPTTDAWTHALAARIATQETHWQWRIEPERAGRPWLLGFTGRAFSLLEVFASCVALAGFIAALVRSTWSRRDAWVAAALTGLALALRAAVPCVPANYYLDYAARTANFRYDETYAPPLYRLFVALHLPATSPFAANIAIGTLVPAILYLGLRALRPRSSTGNGPAALLATPSRLALPFAFLVAVAPLYVRISSSDAPHVMGLGWFAIALVLLAPALTEGRPRDLVTLGLACWLIGTTRRELALAPLMLVPFTWCAEASFARRRNAAATVVLASLLGAVLTRLAWVGHVNMAMELHRAWVLGYVRAIPAALLDRSSLTPWVVTLGIASMVIVALLSARPGVLVLYVALFVAETWIYALSPFEQILADPMASWALARYALVWELLHLYFGVAGLVCLWTWVHAHAPRIGGLLAIALAISAFAPLRRAWTLHAYQLEYRFLRNTLPRIPTSLPLVVVWQKNCGMDYCESLAAPHFGYTSLDPDRAVVVLPTETPLEREIDRLPARFLYFHNALLEVDVTRVGSYRGVRETLEEAHRSDCAFRAAGRLLEASRGLTVREIQLPVGRDQHMDLELWLVDRDAARAAIPECARQSGTRASR